MDGSFFLSKNMVQLWSFYTGASSLNVGRCAEDFIESLLGKEVFFSVYQNKLGNKTCHY